MRNGRMGVTTHYARNYAYANSFPLCLKLCQHIVREPIYQSVGRRRDGTSEISRDPRTKRLQTRRESLARPSKQTNNNF